MQWAQTVDASLFHLVNPAWSSPLLDVVMPFFSGNILFAPLVFATAVLLLWKGGARGRLCVAMILLALVFGDGVVCRTLKEAIHRPRPFLALAQFHVPPSIGKTDSGSMPSSHAANWFAATMIAFIYYRRSIRFMLPLAVLVGFSRIYNGVHYPGDVLAGAILGAGYAAGLVWTANALWQWAGTRWFPIWHQKLPSLLDPVVNGARPAESASDKTLRDQQWMRFGYALILIQYIICTAYIASGVITLSEDEAYQWIWSKHLALSYYSKPLLIALTQWLGTHIWGDTVFGVRFFAPVLGAITSLCLFRFVAKEVNARAAFWLTAILPAVPLLSVGSTLMTVDPLSVMFWVLAMIAGWRAVQENATTADWLWVGLWMGLGFLSKYNPQLPSFALFFILYPPARKQLRRPGPYLALLVNLLFTLPVLIWNAQNHWVTLTHVSQDGNLDKHWAPTPGNLWHAISNFTRDFVLQEFILQNPFFFPVVIMTAIIMWRQKPRSPLLVYFFSMAAPVFLFYFLFTFHSRVLANWIAPSIPPLFCLAVVYWEGRWRDGKQPLKFCLIGGFAIGLLMAVVLRDTNIIGKFTGGHVLPAALDSTRRVKGWGETAALVEQKREEFMKEGKPVFIICDHYGIAGEMTFNIPEAKAGVPDHPLVYFYDSPVPMNQFYFWPGYKSRKGENALYLREVDFKQLTTSDVPKSLVDFVNKFVHWEPPSSDYIDYPIPPLVQAEFESVSDIGCVVSMHKGHPAHRIQIFECRGLR
ncbi:MAG TPA: glycosyltransferase family 39 protein [Verrucomicrobiae bacterium]|nr:glycosyltransferase family 39 protein [Verrucomicrobiae bacterium]